MSKIRKKQLGGFGIDPSLGGLLNGIDLDNLNFAQVADLGSQIGGDPFNQAMAQDDPSIYVNSIVGQAGQNYANITNPLPSAQETQQRIDRDTQVFDRFQQQIGNATGASMFNRYNPFNTQRFRQTQEQAAANQVAQQQQQGQSNATDAFDQFNSLSSLFNFIGNFEKGGKLKKMQEGGNMIPPTEGMGVELFSPDFMGTTRYNNLSADFEGKLQDQYSDQAVELRREIEKEKGKDFTPEEWDTLRHAGTSMYMAAGQGKALAPLRMGYANLMGLLHEIKVGGNFKETVSDIRNNYIGSLIGALPVDVKLKEKLLKKAIENPKLLSVLKPTKEDMQDSDVKTMPPEAIELFIQQHQARERGEGNLRSIVKPQVSLPDELNFGGKAKLGYSDNSPYKNEPSIMIQSGNIDMSKTSIPILAIPDKGTPKVMQPKSGTHIFPDANSVMEIPVMKWGGKRKKKKIPYYQEGGQPVPAGVQLEDDELIITPSMDIMETSARDTHKQMKSDVVTDIIRPEDYVLSNKLKINRKEAEKMSLGFGAMLYREGKIPDMPMEHTIADLFKEGEKSMTLAEYGKRVRKKLPVTDKEDPFSQKTNAANRAARLPYLAAAVYKNEMKRTKGKPEAMFESSFSNPFDTSFSSYSGMKEEGVANMALPTDVQQMQSGGPLDFIPAVQGLTNFAVGIADSLFLAPKRAKIVRKALEEDRTAINQLAQTQGAFSGAATGAALAGYAAQDPTVEAPQYDSTQLEARVRKVPKTLFDYASGRAMAGSRSFQDSVFRNAGSFGQAVNAYSPVHAQNLGLLAGYGMQEVQQNIGLENQYRDKKQAFDDRQIDANTYAKNATRVGRNAQVAGLSGTLAGGISSMGSIESNRQNELRRNKLQQTQATLNASRSQQAGVNNAFDNLFQAASTLPSDMFQVQPIQGPTPPPMNLPPAWNIQGPTQLPLSPLQPLGPNINSNNLPYNQQGSTVPLGPNSVYDPATGLWFG